MRCLLWARDHDVSKNKMGKIKIFISHAHDDIDLASELLNLIRGCIKIDASEIRCTSVPGYALPLGHISGQIKEELSGCDIVIGLITRNGIESNYVNFELVLIKGTAPCFAKTGVFPL